MFSDPVGYQAAVRPGKTALVELASDATLSYGALHERVARAAGWLAANIGDPKGQRVAILGRNSISLLVLALACQRVGAIFVPLNWRLAAAEIAGCVADCAPSLLVVDDDFDASVAGNDVGTTATPDFAAAIDQADERAAEKLDGGTPIILLYTSGTTGTPKGVIVTAENAFFAALNFAVVGEVGAQTVALSDLPMFHTIGLIAVARTTLMMGGTLVISDRFSPPRTLAALASGSLGVTHYFAVPVMVEALELDHAFNAAGLKGLHAIFVGGAPLQPNLVERFLEYGVALVNGYGMSEAGTTIHVPIDAEGVRESAGAVGVPAPYIDVRLVSDGRDVPAGQAGEVWLRGPSVTPGYWGRTAETAAAFSDGWYRTGDVARRDGRGYFTIVDRLKDMYVSGGENVYPAEVEATLAQHPDVLDAAVIGVPDVRWGETGIAFVVPRSGAAIDAEALRAFCADRIAKYKCPARFIEVSAIPRSAAGKILKPLLRRQLFQGEPQ